MADFFELLELWVVQVRARHSLPITLAQRNSLIWLNLRIWSGLVFKTIRCARIILRLVTNTLCYLFEGPFHALRLFRWLSAWHALRFFSCLQIKLAYFSRLLQGHFSDVLLWLNSRSWLFVQLIKSLDASHLITLGHLQNQRRVVELIPRWMLNGLVGHWDEFSLFLKCRLGATAPRNSKLQNSGSNQSIL